MFELMLKSLGISPDEIQAMIAEARQTLYEYKVTLNRIEGDIAEINQRLGALEMKGENNDHD